MIFGMLNFYSQTSVIIFLWFLPSNFPQIHASHSTGIVGLQLDHRNSSPYWKNIWNYAGDDWDYNGDGGDLLSTPFPRKSHSLINWGRRNLLVVYGGLDTNGNVLKDVWQYNYSSSQNQNNHDDSDQRWTNIGCKDSQWIQPYAGHLGLLREVTEEMIIFGGMTSQRSLDAPYTTAGSNLVWTFDLNNNTWSVNEYHAYSPLQRTEAVGGIFNDELYIYGGMDVETLSDYSDLWKYNFVNKTWTLLDSGQETGPFTRFSHAGCIFGASFVTFGGRRMTGSSYGMLSDVWTFDLKERKWEQVTIGVQFARAYHSMVPYNGFIWVFGGFSRVTVNGEASVNFAFNSLLVQDLTSSAWKQFNPSDQPEVRFDHRAAVTNKGVMYVYGGRYQSVDDVEELISLDLSEISPEMLVDAKPDEFDIPNSSIAAIYSAHFVIAILALTSGCSCITLIAIRRRFRNRQQFLLQQDDFLFLSTRSVESTPQQGLDETIVRSMPLVYYHGSAAPGSMLSEQGGEADICSICLLEFEEGKALRQLPCNHEFHPSCVEAWLLGHANCPLCKQEFDSLGNFVRQSGTSSLQSPSLSAGSTLRDESDEVSHRIPIGNSRLSRTSQNYGTYNA